ncbi:uncharacterized protein [Choristoneura fumiferana]|uniref:uncharacterized protein n=1 Tax=Choristoneura fumiferana TaxID=7141 RepID=UPI003D15D422
MQALFSIISEKYEELQEDTIPWRPGTSYLSWGGHVMYLPPAPAAPAQPLSMLGPIDRPVRSKSSGSLEVAARAARAAALANEMRERERSASPDVARALPARVQPVPEQGSRWPILCLPILLAASVCGSDILMITMGGTKSHKMPFWELARGLIRRATT